MNEVYQYIRMIEIILILQGILCIFIILYSLFHKNKQHQEIHSLKILSEYFNDVKKGIKTFEVRKNDRDYKVGDILILKEWIPGENSIEGHYTNKNIRKKIVYILEGGKFGLDNDYVILGIK